MTTAFQRFSVRRNAYERALRNMQPTAPLLARSVYARSREEPREPTVTACYNSAARARAGGLCVTQAVGGTLRYIHAARDSARRRYLPLTVTGCTVLLRRGLCVTRCYETASEGVLFY
jgi:hypothetical protein